MMQGPPREGSASAAPTPEKLPHEYLPPALWQEPFKLSKLLKSIFLEGRKMLISVLLAMCFARDELFPREDSDALRNRGSALGCGDHWVGFCGDRGDAAQRGVILAFACIKGCRGGCLGQSGDFIQLTWACRLPGSRTLPWVIAAALHLVLVFSTRLQRPSKPD